ncbi:MAG: anthranilate phosphoribosyltransferase, partial [Microthrixaceae bacterium]|nr:anthranilate phosphoribosyltransferase [Microthrixaceae bacterium]
MSELDDHGGWAGVLGRLVAGEDLGPDLAAAVLQEVLGGNVSPARTAAFLTGLRCKGESPAEVAAMVEAMLR